MAAFHLLKFTPKVSLTKAVAAELVENMNADDWKIMHMYHHANLKTQLSIRRQLRAFYRTPASYVYGGNGEFVPTDTWWTKHLPSSLDHEEYDEE